MNYAPANVLRSLDGLHILEMIYELESFLGKKGERFRKEAFSRLRELEVEAATKKSLFSFTRDVLKTLKDRGLRRGIITRTCIDAITAVFPDYNTYIEVVVTRDDVKMVKPHPEHVQRVLEELGVAPHESIVVGDHPTDVIAGRRLGTKTVGVLTGRTTEEEFMKVGVTYIFPDIRGIVEII